MDLFVRIIDTIVKYFIGNYSYDAETYMQVYTCVELLIILIVFIIVYIIVELIRSLIKSNKEKRLSSGEAA